MNLISSNRAEIDIKKFKKVKRISKGGFGVVYTVEEKKTGELFAAKIVDCDDDEEICNQMIKREITIMMYARHPTIIKFIGYSKRDFQDENNIIIIMELAKNGSLKDVLKKIQKGDGPKDYTNTSRQIILVGVARGMKFLHDRSIIHRDLKTDNILLDEDFHPHITDFGMSKFIETGHTRSQTKFGGTLAYEAPEILQCLKYDQKVDVYAFAILMFEILTDSVPYPELEKEEVNTFKFTNKIIKKNYRPKFTVPIKKSFKNLIERCWSSNPDDRPEFGEIFTLLLNKNDQEDKDEDFMLDDVDVDEFNLYVEDITEVTDSTEKLLSKITQKDTEIKKLNEEITNLKSENKRQGDEIKQLKTENKRQGDEIKQLKTENKKLRNKIESENKVKNKKEADELVLNPSKPRISKKMKQKVQSFFADEDSDSSLDFSSFTAESDSATPNPNEVEQAMSFDALPEMNDTNELQEDKKIPKKEINNSVHRPAKKVVNQRNAELHQKKREFGVESIIVGGYDRYNQLGENSNNKNKKGAPIISPPVKLSFDPSSLLSYSTYCDHSVLVMSDGSLKGIGDNEDGRISATLQKTVIEDFTDFCIKDGSGRQLAAISAVCYEYGTLYMFSKSSGNERQLVLCDSSINGGDPVFLDIGNHHPVSLFGGDCHSAAIGSEGEVIFINRYSVKNSPNSPIAAVSLPDGEKASSVACCNKSVVVLSSNGRVFTSPIEEGSSVLNFSIVSEISGQEIVCVSGAYNHFLAVSKDGRVFGRGSNGYGQLCLDEETKSVSSFTEISSLVGYEIRAAYAGHNHSLFETREGKILSCGWNYNGPLLLSSGPYRKVYSPRETTITNGSAFCIAGNNISVVFIGSNPPPNTPNKRIDEYE